MIGGNQLNIEQLSKRLETVVSFINKGARIADIGSDHAYLPCYAINKGIASTAIAGEIVDGPYQSAVQQVKKAELTQKIEVRKGDGLSVIQKGEVDTVVIAGMGGGLITQILQEGAEKLDGVTQLILQPNIAAHHIRLWLLNNGWELKNEAILEEDNKIYEILMAEKGKTNKPYNQLEKEILVGPFLLAEKNLVFLKKWTHEKNKLEKIIDSLENSESEENQKRKAELQAQLTMIMEVLS